MKVLIVGGAGYIGSTVASACLDAGHEPVILDDLSTGHADFVAGRIWYRGDMADQGLVDQIFTDHPDIRVVIDCAALIIAPDSVTDPISYYRTNVAKVVELADAVLRNSCHRFIFSSSAAIYGTGPDLAVDEDSPLEPLNPYGRSKMFAEQILHDIAAATPLQVMSLRYFNPIGVDPQLRSGPRAGGPTNVVGRLIEAADSGGAFSITGTDYPTPDGTGMRDYIHVWDLAQAHVRALERFDEVLADQDSRPLNLGTGRGTTVRELHRSFERVTGRSVPVHLTERRPGDIAGAYTRNDRARAALDWEPTLTLDDGIADTVRWHQAHTDT